MESVGQKGITGKNHNITGENRCMTSVAGFDNDIFASYFKSTSCRVGSCKMADAGGLFARKRKNAIPMGRKRLATCWYERGDGATFGRKWHKS